MKHPVSNQISNIKYQLSNIKSKTCFNINLVFIPWKKIADEKTSFHQRHKNLKDKKIIYNKNKIHQKKNYGDIWRWQLRKEEKTLFVSIESNQVNFLFHWNICTQSLQYEKRSRVNPLKDEF